MKRTGGVFDKIGNWYEQGSLVLQWLRILLDHAQSVTWEPGGTAGIGVDYLLIEEDRRIAVQCKTRSRKPWSAAEMSDLLAHAERQLHGGAHVFRFVTDLKPSGLAAAERAAKSGMEPHVWRQEAKERDGFVRALACDPDDPGDLARAVALFQAIEVRVVSQSEYDERMWELASALAGDDNAALLGHLGLLTRDPALSRPWTAVALRAELASTPIHWRGTSERTTTASWLLTLNNQFLSQVTHSRRGHVRYERTDVDRVLTACEAGMRNGVILIHGGAGIGKSDIIGQVVERLMHQRMPVLALRADATRDTFVGEDPINRFRGVLGDGPGCVVIDQLDQIAATPAQAQSKILLLERWVRSALKSGMAVIIGCRSVDAVHETQIHQVIGHVGQNIIAIQISPLSEAIVQKVLTPLGVPLDLLGSDLMRMARVPMILSLLVDLIQKRGGWRGATSTHDLVDLWCQMISKDLGAGAIDAIDAIITAMEQDGLIVVDLMSLNQQHRENINTLIHAGIVILETGGRIRLFHQTIADARTALRWGNVHDATKLLELLGPREQQDFIIARRLRLSIPRLAAHGARGSAIIAAVTFHSDVRFLLRRAIFLGLADLDNISMEVRNLVTAWLDRPECREEVLSTVVHGQTSWMDVLDTWMDSAWTSIPELHSILLHNLAAISTRRGAAVAAHLSRWETETPGTLTNCRMAFWHDPSEDSDELFRIRIDYLATTEGKGQYTNWTTLFEQHPLRAAALVAVMLNKITPAELTGFDPPNWLHDWPQSVPTQALPFGNSIWNELRSWWLTVTIENIQNVSTAWNTLPDSSLIVIARFLAQCLASSLANGQTTWQCLVADFPTPMREIDGRLLLLVGAQLPSKDCPVQVFDDAAQWFMDDKRWARLNVGRHNTKQLMLAKNFVTAIASGASLDVFAALEHWLVGFRDEWTVKDEQIRYHIDEVTGRLRPNTIGQTAYLLLPSLGKNRWSALAQRYHRHLEMKFERHTTELFEETDGTYGLVGAKVPVSTAKQWDAARWLKELKSAPDVDHHHRQLTKDRVGEHTKGQLVILLHHCASENPNGYIPVAEFFASNRDGLPNRAFAVLIEALGRTTPLNTPPPESTWSPLDDTTFARIAMLPAFLNGEDTALDLARSVEARSEYEWPEAMVDRLIVLSESTSGAFTQPDQEHALLQFRYNDPACVALQTLSRLATHHAVLKPKLLREAERLVQHADQGRRASAASLALQCFDADPTRAANTVLRAAADPLIAGESDINQGVRFLAIDKSLSENHHIIARSIIVNLVSQSNPHLSEWGGIGVLLLRCWDVITHDELVTALRPYPMARTSVAKTLAQWIRDLDAPPWMKTYAIELANDLQPTVGDAIMSALRASGSSHLFDDQNFVHVFAQSAAAQRNIVNYIEACDGRGTLLPIKDAVLTIGRTFLHQRSEDGDVWKYQHDLQRVSGFLLRLYEEGKRSGDTMVTIQVLDIIDSLIALGRFPSGQMLALMTQSE